MRITNEKLKDPVYITGLVLAVVSFLFYMVPVIYPSSVSTASGGLFLVNFSITAIYLVLLFARGIIKKRASKLHHIILFLILFLISAYSLNREMAVFEQSVPWFAVLLIIICINYILFIFFDTLPGWAKYILCTIAGIAMVVFLYLALYLMPLYAFSAFAFFALGISLHSFVPLLFCIYTIVLFRKLDVGTKKYWVPFAIGASLPVIVAIVYAIMWNTNLSSINKNFRYSTITENDRLPSWVTVAQRIPKNSITEKILKSEIVYSVPGKGEDFFWRMPTLNFEKRIHDPLIMVGSLFSGPVRVPEKDRIKILESMYDSRHEAQERLWAGNDLVTEYVSTKAQLWPALRIAYTELNIVVSHIPDNSSWTNTQEAIYTFHLPEGGVVTSLSLWIEGREEKGILTTKSKADTAYKTIVGVERRDPSVVHWQEGNTITVRVFPVVKGESRKFKLGVTAPLAFNNNKLTYENIYFDGPSFVGATSDIDISSKEPLQDVAMSAGFTEDKNHILKSNEKYSPAWSVSFNAPGLRSDVFSFNNYSYDVIPSHTETVSFDPSSIFLDINSSWSAEECEKIYQLVKNKKIFVSDGQEDFAELNSSNKHSLFEQLTSHNFSLFPFYKITNSDQALVISKSGPVSPSIDDLRSSSFLTNLHNYFNNAKPVKLFNLDDTLSPYLKSLKEFRMLAYDQGNEQKLQELLSKKIFIQQIESDNEVNIYDAGIALRRTQDSAVSNAPDHLMRLFAYNHILQQSGSAILADTLNEEPLINEAQEAYVVSPFSSLVVLETQKDYDRFNITASKNSLQNASLKSKGAVPEPHEWALIILVLLVCVWIKFRPTFSLIKTK